MPELTRSPEGGPARRNAVLALGGAMIVWAIVIWSYRSRLGFIADDWSFIFHRMDGGIDSFMDPHGEHIVVLFVVIFRLFVELFGISSAVPLHIFSMLMLAAVAVTVYLYTGDLIGEYLAVLGSVVLLFLGAGYEDLLWIFQSCFSVSIATGVGALILLRRRDRTGDLSACVLLAISVLTVSLGLPFLAGAAVAILLSDGRLRRSYVFLIPLVLFVCWYAGWGREADNWTSMANLIHTPVYVFNAFAYSLAVLTGLFKLDGAASQWLPRLLAFAVLLGIGLRSWKQRRVPPELIIGLAIGIAFWGLAGWNQIPGLDARNFDQSRYQIPNAAIALIVLSGGFAGLRPSIGVKAVLSAVAVAAVWANMVALSDGFKGLESASDRGKFNTTALDLLGPEHVDPSFVAALDEIGYQSVDAKTYFETTGRFGPAGLSSSELAEASPSVQAGVDLMLMTVDPIVVSASKTRPSGVCHQVRQAGPDLSQPVRLTRGLVIGSQGGGTLTAYRFSPDQSRDLIDLGGNWVRLRPPEDGIPTPWQLQVEGPGPVRVCAAR